jgi:CRP-like cAMP-binding protein
VSDPQPIILSADQLLGQPSGQGWESVPLSLPAVGILAGLAEESLATLSSFGQYQVYPMDELVIKEGEHLERFYVVVSGMLEIFTETGSNHTVLSYAEPGECVGEVSLLEPGPATASVRARTESTLWTMGLEDLRKFLSDHVGTGGALMFGMAKCLAQRVRHADDLIRKSQLPKSTNMVRSEAPIRATVPPPPVTGNFFSKLNFGIGGQKKTVLPTEIKM